MFIFPALDGEVACSGEGGPDESVFAGERGRREVDFQLFYLLESRWLKGVYSLTELFQIFIIIQGSQISLREI